VCLGSFGVVVLFFSGLAICLASLLYFNSSCFFYVRVLHDQCRNAGSKLKDWTG